MRRAPGYSILLVTLLVVSWPSALSLNPLDNDAESGRDAGDDAADALPINPGRYEGALNGAMDFRDCFSITLDAGDRVELAFQTSGWLGLITLGQIRHSSPAQRCLPSSVLELGSEGGRAHNAALVPETGTWHIAIASAAIELASLPAAGPGSQAYEFEVSVNRPASRLFRVAAGEGVAVEARWNEPLVLGFCAAVEINRGDSDMLWFRIQNRTGIGTAAAVSSFGSSVTVSGHPTPDLHVPLPIFSPENASFGFAWCLEFDVPAGSAQVAAFGLAPGAFVWVALWSEGPLELASADNDGLTDWSSSTGPPHQQLLVPAVAAVDGPQSFDLVVDRPFVGVFEAPTPDYSVTAPDGRQFHNLCGCHFLVDLQPGLWNFHVGESTALGSGENQFLAGVSFPPMGLYQSDLRGPPS